MKYIVYLAGPIAGLSFDGCVDWREEIISCLPPEIIGLSPMRGYTYLEGLNHIGAYIGDDHELNAKSKVTHLKDVMTSARGMITRDFNDCRRADAVIANLAGAKKVSIGTAMEIAWAKAFNIPVICIMEETGNLHDHPMITECIGFRVNNVGEALDVLNMLLLPVSHREE